MNFVRSGDGALVFDVSSHVYSDAVLAKALYWYTGSYEVELDAPERHARRITIRVRGGSLDERTFEELCSSLRRDLVDFKLRDIVRNESGAIHDLIVAKAFAPTDEFDEL